MVNERTRSVSLIPWAEYRQQMRWTEGSSNGLRLATGPSVEADGLSARLMRLPAGPDGSDANLDCDVDRIWLQVRGEERISVGQSDFDLSPRDLLYLPAGQPLRLMNIGAIEAMALEVRVGTRPDRATPAAVAHLWRDYYPLVNWDLPLAQQWGYVRGSFPPIKTPTAWAHLMRHLPGQSTPVHSVPSDLIFIGLEETAQFEIQGSTYDLGPCDLMVVPGDTPYRYTNHGFSETIFLDVGLSAKPGQNSHYFNSDGSAMQR